MNDRYRAELCSNAGLRFNLRMLNKNLKVQECDARKV